VLARAAHRDLCDRHQVKILDFRNVDWSPEMLESEITQCDYRILVVNRGGRQTRIQ
jgi:hypothetical protein